MRARVIVVAGPSGAGKTVLCRRLATERGWPVVNLDDFYKDGSDPTLPVRALPGGAPVVDWDDPASWSCDEAVLALEALCRGGRAEVPVYSLADDGRVGSRAVDVGTSAYVLAEGIFADRVVTACRDREVLADAVCVRTPRLVTFGRRLVRDLREHRKPPLVLLRRGLALLGAEPAIVARARAAGCAVVSPREAHRRLSSVA